MQKIIILGLMAVILGVPFLFQQTTPGAGRDAQDRVIVVSPHGENIRREFGEAFQRWYHEQTGRTIRVDWRVLGGTSQITEALNATFSNNFRNYWQNELGRSWNSTIQSAFVRPMELPDDPADDTLEQSARRAWLNSDVGVEIDVFFGGGSFDFNRQAARGNLVPFDTPENLAARFTDDIFPQTFAGEPFWDPEGRWIGAVLSTFGIVFNRNALSRLGIEEEPNAWEDLTDPRFAGQIILADPSKSGSSNKAFEMIIQQVMQRRLAQIEESPDYAHLSPEEQEQLAVSEGWMEGFQIIQRISANARLFTDVSTQPAIDVSSGDSAAGMTIDFFGRFQAEIIAQRGDQDRFAFVSPPAGSTVSVDPIAILRGAPNPELAHMFMDFVLSEEGQKIWALRPASPGGPRTFALRRSPALRTLYNREDLLPYLSDPDVDPYRDAGDFVYRPEWTGHLFNPLRFLIRVAFIDSAIELRKAWNAIIQAQEEGRYEDADAALAHLSDLSILNFEQTSGPIRDALNSANKIEEVRLARDLSRYFRDRYNEARRIARTGIILQD